MRLCGLLRDFFLSSSFVLLYLYVMCNYQGEIFAINEAEFKISAATLLNFFFKKKYERMCKKNMKSIKYFRSTCCVTPSNFKIMHIIFGITLIIFEKNETYRPAYYFGLLLKRYFTKMPRNLRDYKAVKMSN